jgi:DNA-binding NtrC family response regulator
MEPAGTPDMWLMIVEPDIVVRHMLAQYLRSCGYHVAEAANTKEARRLLEEAGLAIDLVLADASEDSSASFALGNWIRAEHPQVDFIMGGTPATLAREAGEICGDGPALVKPYDHGVVLQQIKQFLSARARSRATA